MRPLQHAAGVFFPQKKVILDLCALCNMPQAFFPQKKVILDFCALCNMPQAPFFPAKRPTLDFPSTSYLRNRVVLRVYTTPSWDIPIRTGIRMGILHERLPHGEFPYELGFVWDFSIGPALATARRCPPPTRHHPSIPHACDP